MAEADALTATANPHLSLVAFCPGELRTAQAHLVGWCEQKIARCQEEAQEAATAVKVAQHSKWAVGTLKAHARKARRRVDFYRKIRAALEAGYLIIPNFPVDVFAVRTARTVPSDASIYPRASLIPDERPQDIPAGEGQYVLPRQTVTHQTVTVPAADGKMEKRQEWWATALRDPEFPVAAVKPVVLEATARAMALRVFDRIGLVGRRRDPIVVGQILDPRSTRWNQRAVTFFVAWWLDPERHL